MITLGNHAYHRSEILPYLDRDERILRPANYLRSQPGHGTCMVERDGVRLGVVNLSGNVFMRAGHPAFPEADACVNELRRPAPTTILVDFHAEATSEKVALGWHLDGRVTAVVGTHTHVPTADARVLPGGTAYITDVGHDRAARRRHRRQARAGDRVARHADARALRDRRGGPVAQRRPHPLLGAATGCGDRAAAAAVPGSHAGELTGAGSAAGSRPRKAISASGTAHTR